MDKKYDALFTPWKIGNVEIKNRIVMCSMGGTCLFGFAEPKAALPKKFTPTSCFEDF